MADLGQTPRYRDNKSTAKIVFMVFTDQKVYALSLIGRKWVRAGNAIFRCRLVSKLELDIFIVAPTFSHRPGRVFCSVSTPLSFLHQTFLQFLTCPWGFSVRWKLPCRLQPGGQLVVRYPGVFSVKMCQDFHDFYCMTFHPRLNTKVQLV